MNITQSKVACQFRFFTIDEPDSMTEPFDGVFHLFEHHYGDHTLFWYGVAEIACSPGRYEIAWGQGENHDYFSIQVELSDGRMGNTRVLNSSWTINSMGEMTEVALVGISGLHQVNDPAEE